MNTDESINDSVVIELKKIEARTGLRFSIIEADYKKFFDEYKKNNPKTTLQMCQMYARMRVDAETQNLNGISSYNLFTLGVKDIPNGKHVLGYTMMQEKDGKGGDPKDLFDPANGKFGIISSVSLWGDITARADGVQELAFYNIDGSSTATGIPRREIRANSYTNFVGINVPLPPDSIQAFMDKNYPLMTLAQLKTKEGQSRLMAARALSAKQFVDELDLKRTQVFLSHSASHLKKDGTGDFSSYTVIDASLTDAEKYNILNPDGTVKEYGGVQVIVPSSIFKKENIADGAMVEILCTSETYKDKLQLNAVSIKIVAGERRKTPISQKPGQQQQTVVKSQSLADMANKPVTYI